MSSDCREKKCLVWWWRRRRPSSSVSCLNTVLVNSSTSILTKAGFANVLTICIFFQTESVPIATYNQLLDANHSTMTAVRDKSRAAADQMNAAAKNAEQAVR